MAYHVLMIFFSKKKEDLDEIAIWFCHKYRMHKL